jgi:hypothetical protein
LKDTGVGKNDGNTTNTVHTSISLLIWCWTIFCLQANIQEPFLSNGFANMFAQKQLNYNNEQCFLCGARQNVLSGKSWELQLVSQ